MEQLDLLKAQWKDTNVRLNNLETEINNIALSRRKSRLDVLAGNYRRFSIIAIVMLAVSYPYWTWMLASAESPNPACPVLWVAVFAVALAADSFLWYKVSRIRVDTMSVMQVADAARRCRRIHLMSQCVLLPLAVAFVIAMAMLSSDPYFRWGIVAGVIVGAAIGFGKWRKMMKAYRELARPDSLCSE